MHMNIYLIINYPLFDEDSNVLKSTFIFLITKNILFNTILKSFNTKLNIFYVHGNVHMPMTFYILIFY